MTTLNIRRGTTLGLALSAVVAASTAQAALFPPPSGPIYFQFTNEEQTDIGTDAAGNPTNSTSSCGGCSGAAEGNWGIAQLSILREGVENPAGVGAGVVGNDIDSAGTVPIFVDLALPTAGNQITAMFYGITQTSISTSSTACPVSSRAVSDTPSRRSCF